MSESDLPELLRQIRQAGADACIFIEGMGREDFLDDKRTHPDIPWREMRGLRNRIAHGYFDVDLGIVWDTVRKDLPDLLTKLSL